MAPFEAEFPLSFILNEKEIAFADQVPADFRRWV
jgi:hypothetical protein